MNGRVENQRRTRGKSRSRWLITALAAVPVALSISFTISSLLPRKPYVLDLAAQASHWVLFAQLALVPALIALRRIRLGLLALIAAGASASALFFFASPRPTQSDNGPHIPIRVITFNSLNAKSLNDQALLEWLVQQNPDFVAVIDAMPGFGRNHSGVNQSLPYRLEPHRGANWPIVLLSKHPIEAVRLGERSDETMYSYVANRAIKATLPNGPSVILTAMHPYSPRTSGKWRTSLAQVERDARVLASARRQFAAPILVAADHNSTPMGMLHRRFRHITGMSTRSNPFAGTWPATNHPVFAFPIDRVWASPEVRFVRSRVGPAFRSDHRPVVVDLLIPARSSTQPAATEP